MSNSVVTKNYGLYTSHQVKESVSEAANTNLYLAFGRILPWDDESSPETANTSYVAVREVWNSMIGGKRVTENNIEHVIPRIDWTANTVYNHYDDRDTDLYDRQFYVMNSEFKVYKCLSNNSNTLSTVEPTSVITDNISQTLDGYIWKFMYELNSEDKHLFLTNDYIPVRQISVDNGSLQWDVQNEAVDGSIQNIFLENAGSYFTDDITLTITGDGGGANAYAQVNTVSNMIANVTVDVPGSGYTYADVTLAGGSGSGAVFRVPIGPYGGHGSNPLHELGGSNLMFNIRLRGDEGGTIPIVNNFRRVSLLRDPLSFADGTTTFSNATFTMTTDLTLTGISSDYTEDEVVFQGYNLAQSTFRGTIVEYDSANNIMKLNNVEGSPSAATLTGIDSGSTSFIASVDDADVIKYSGHVLYIDNVEEIKRNEFQTENFRVVLKY